jgi:calpain
LVQDGKLCGQDFEALRQGCLDNGELFTDPEFPPDDQSLYFSQETPFAFEWKRASEITDGACLFEGGATRFDINQGELGDCWLLAALANLTLNKRLLYQGKSRYCHLIFGVLTWTKQFKGLFLNIAL